MTWLLEILILTSICRYLMCCNLEDFFLERRVSIETAAVENPIVFQGLIVVASPWINPEDSEVSFNGTFEARFDLIHTFKDTDGSLVNFQDDLNDRHVNVTISMTKESHYLNCIEGLAIPSEYIVFGYPVEEKGRLVAASVTRWSEAADQRVWAALGWSSWSEWTPCSVPCSLGIQQRSRKCLLPIECPGYNVEQRHCNMFGCDRTINPLTLEDRHFFHPTIDFWHRAPDRPTAWRLEPYTYLWIPSVLLLHGMKGVTEFPKQFAIFFTVRLSNGTSGTIFSLRSRTKQNSYLSLELREEDIKLTNAANNETDSILIPSRLNDGHWHQVSLSIQSDNIMECFVDCKWISRNFLRKNTFNLPDDSDFILGYLFSGDIEQFSVVTDPGLVNLQCSSQIIPIFEPRA